MTSFYIGKNLIQIWEETQTIRTTFPDGTSLIAAPEDNYEYLRMAQNLGYGGETWAMCKSHEILHTAIAVGQGKEYSRGLHRAAQGIEPDDEDRLEEALVLETQKLTI